MNQKLIKKVAYLAGTYLDISYFQKVINSSFENLLALGFNSIEHFRDFRLY